MSYSNSNHCEKEKYLTKIKKLKNRIIELKKVEKEYKKNIEELKQKEAFNFALFQYNPTIIVVVDKDGRVIKTNAAKRRSGDRLPQIGDIMYKDYASHHTIDMHKELIEAMTTGVTKHFKELPYKDKILSITIAPFPEGAIIISEDKTEQKKAEVDRIKLIEDLRKALKEVETLRGLLPICASCKKIRDDHGYWSSIEEYFTTHSHIDFTHTLCPDCLKLYYPDYWQIMENKKAAASSK